MECQNCHERPATVHYTNIVNGEKTEMHLCEQCAHQQGDFFSGNQSFSLNHLLSGLLNYEQPGTGSKPLTYGQPEELACDRCGMTYREFTKIGRFGCAHCYETFKDQIEPILKRVHSGNTVHAGKIPKRIGGTIHLRKEMNRLRETMQEHIKAEEFEKAAEIRDQLRSLERKLNGEQGGGE